MSLFLAHVGLLLLASHLAARKVWRAETERWIATLLLAWGNLVITSLLLASLHHLGDPGWFFRLSLILALVTWFALRRVVPEPTPATETGTDRLSPRLLLLFCASLLPLVYMGIRIAATYEPNNYDSLTYHLPRAMYYLGQNNLAHFDTGNPRQTFFPFNYNLLQLFGLIYNPPLQVVNFINLVAWAVGGTAIYRLCRLAAASNAAALGATWLALTSTQVLAQATATTNDLPTGVALLGALVFVIRWIETQRTRDALGAGLALGLAIGSKLTVIFFVPAGGLLIAFLVFRHYRQAGVTSVLRGVRAWVLPGVLAFTMAAPFALINLAEAGEWINKTYDFTLNRPFSFACAAQTTSAYLVQMFLEPLHRFTFDLKLTEELNRWGAHTFFPHWNASYAFSPLYLFPPDLNEDHVWFGLTGPLILFAAVYALFRSRGRQAPAAWLAWIGLGWFVAYFLLNKWSLYNQRYFVLPMLVLSPALAALLDIAWAKPSRQRLTRNLFVFFALGALWLAGVYLFQNTSRPYAPLWAGQPPPPALPSLPPVMVERLSGQTKVNIDSTDGNERIFLLMNLGRNQRFTAHDRTDPEAYNVYSEWGFVRKVAYSNIEQLSSYTIVDFPTKKSAGVEFLGTIGAGQPALDYYGLAAHPELAPATPTNRHVLVNFYYGPRDPGRYAKLRIKVAGLNQPDQARLKVGVDFDNGTSEVLATFTETGEAMASVTRPFRRFTLRLEDNTDGRTLGSIDLPYRVRDESTEDEAPYDPISLFSDQLVTTNPKSRMVIEGLAPPEGPYPQWDLPVFRWAKSPVLRLEIPAQKHLNRLELSFELRLHTRDSAHFDIIFNGQLIEACEWNTATGWFIRRISLTPKSGPNVIEIRNVAVSTKPDWLDYLERYPDVKAYVISQGIPLKLGAREHYETFGKKEHRLLHHERHTVTLPGDQLYYLFRSLRVEGYRKP